MRVLCSVNFSYISCQYDGNENELMSKIFSHKFSLPLNFFSFAKNLNEFFIEKEMVEIEEETTKFIKRFY